MNEENRAFYEDSSGMESYSRFQDSLEAGRLEYFNVADFEDIIEQLIDNIPEGEFYIKQKPIIKVPEGQWFFSVEGGAGEFGVYLDSHGDKSPYRLKMRPMGLTLTGAFDKMLRGQKIADLVATGAAIDFVIPDIDR